MAKNDGGPAFPCRVPITVGIPGHESFPGMSLRDYFAGQAVGGYLAMHADPECSAPKAVDLSEYCYKIADALLAAREAGKAVAP